MNSKWHFFSSLWIILMLASIAALFWGWHAFLMVFSIFLLYRNIHHEIHLQKLKSYLQKQALIPDASGDWKEIFELLAEKEKKAFKQKKQLHDALKRFQRAAEQMPHGVLLLKKGRIEWFNQKAGHYLQLKEEDKNGILLNLIRQPAFNQFLKSQEKEVEIHFQEQSLDIECDLHILRCPFEEKTDLLHISDISLEKNHQRKRSMFISNASHELRTPLTVLKGFMEHFEDWEEMHDAQRNQFLKLMHHQIQRMEWIIRDLTFLSRLESQHHQEKKHERIHLSALAKQVFWDTEALSQHQHHFDSEIEENIFLKGHEQELYSALSNVAFNAVHYTPAGGKIILKLYRDQQQKNIVFSVQDTGVGIEAQHIPHLTERFFRINQQRLQHRQGTGLGLAICKHVLIEHQAHLHIESIPNKGSIFYLIFPDSSA